MLLSLLLSIVLVLACLNPWNIDNQKFILRILSSGLLVSLRFDQIEHHHYILMPFAITSRPNGWKCHQ